jgi:hypothetical protein
MKQLTITTDFQFKSDPDNRFCLCFGRWIEASSLYDDSTPPLSAIALRDYSLASMDSRELSKSDIYAL